MAVIWITALNFPHRSAAITLPSNAAITRRVETINSRKRIKNTAQIGTSSSLMPTNTIKIQNRKEAIAKAISIQNNEILLILGKGDEDYQEINGVKYPFSDQEVVKEILSKKG